MHKFISFCCVVLFLIGGASSISSPAFAQSTEPYPVDPPTPNSVSTNKKVQITEIGFDTSPKKKPIPGTLSGAGANPCAYLYGTLVTEEEQREYLKQAYSILLSNSPVDKVIWYRYDDIYQSVPVDAINLDCGQAAANWQKDRWVSVPIDPMGVTARQFNPQLVYLTHWFGLRDVNGHIKPAYCAMTEVTGAGFCPLSNPVYLPIIELSRGNLPMPAVYLTAKEIPPTAVSLHRQTVRCN